MKQLVKSGVNTRWKKKQRRRDHKEFLNHQRRNTRPGGGSPANPEKEHPENHFSTHTDNRERFIQTWMIPMR
jgi:hypothetical protein